MRLFFVCQILINMAHTCSKAMKGGVCGAEGVGEGGRVKVMTQKEFMYPSSLYLHEEVLHFLPATQRRIHTVVFWVLVLISGKSFTMSRAVDALQMKEEDVLKFLTAGTHLGSTNFDFKMEQ